MSIQQGPFDVHQLAGSIAVVTGAGNGGIGWGLARHCAALGMDVALIDLYANLVQDAQVKLSTLHPGIRCAGIECDVAKPQSLEACVAAVRREFGDKPIGAVFANAGVLFGIGTPILCSSMDEWQTTMNVNVIGVVNTIKAFVPLLQQQNSPSVMCPTASIGGLMRGGLYSSASYQASKHAVVAISEALYGASEKVPTDPCPCGLPLRRWHCSHRYICHQQSCGGRRDGQGQGFGSNCQSFARFDEPCHDPRATCAAGL